jgi:hypothetical protein
MGPSRGAARPVQAVARVRLEKMPAPAIAARERPPVFHVFEELYARTLREVQARPSAAVLATGPR